MRQVVFPSLRGDFLAQELGEKTPFVGARASDFEPVMRKDGDHRLAQLEFQRRGHAVRVAPLDLGHHPGGPHHGGVGARAAVGDIYVARGIHSQGDWVAHLRVDC